MNKIIKAYKYIVALILGHFTVLKHAFKKPVTLEYPEKKCELNLNFRGEHALVLDEDGKLFCTACGTCQRVCPSPGTITIEREKNEEGKSVLKDYKIDLNKCIFCGNCVYHCPYSAIVMTKHYELANEKKSSLILDINDLKRNFSDTIVNKK